MGGVVGGQPRERGFTGAGRVAGQVERGQHRVQGIFGEGLGPAPGIAPLGLQAGTLGQPQQGVGVVAHRGGSSLRAFGTLASSRATPWATTV
ncbi:hypothetical protein D3C86_1275820 [compost metagenome]